MKQMLFSKVLLLCVFTLCQSVKGQTLLRGQILDSKTQQPIVNAKFGITDQGIGVVTDTSGSFFYRKYHGVLDETSRFEVSANGYRSLMGSIDVLRKLQNKRGIIYLEKQPNPEKGMALSNKIGVFWDASGKSNTRNVADEITYLIDYVASTNASEISIVIFNERIITRQKFIISERNDAAIQKLLNEVVYEGVSDYGLLPDPNVDELLLFAEEPPTFGMFRIHQDLPVHIVNSSRTIVADAYFESLAQYTSGTYKKLQKPNAATVGINDGNYVTGQFLLGNAPIPYAIISKKGELEEYYTDAEGHFKVPAAEGDVLTFYSLGNYPKTLAITSKTEYSVIAMPKAEQLDEVLLRSERGRSGYAFDSLRQLDMVEGRTVPVRSVYKSQFNKNAFTIGEAIDGIYGARSFYDVKTGNTYITVRGGCARVFVDGNESGVAAIPINLVENISIYESQSLVLPCPSRIIVTTRLHPDRIDQRLRKKGYELLENNVYTENVPNLETKSSDTDYFPKKTITGTIMGNGTVLQGASIVRKGTLDEVQTDANGSFSMQVAEGDILEIRHFGMHPKSVVVTDKLEYAIRLITKAEILDEVELSKKVESDIAYDSFDSISRVETVNGRKYDVRNVLFKEDLNLSGIDIYEMVGLSDSKIIVKENAASGQKVLFYRRGPATGVSYIPLTAVVDGVATNTMHINPLMVERVSVYIAPLRENSMIFITTRNHPDIRKKWLAEHQVALKNNRYEEKLSQLEGPKNTYFELKKIVGEVLVKGIPLEGASVLKKGSLNEVLTDRDGSFTTQAVAGDILEIKHPGMYPKSLVVTDSTSYTISLINKTEILDEVAVTASNAEAQETIGTATGAKEKKSVGYAVDSELSQFISPADVSFDQVARKIPGVLVDPTTKQLFYQRSYGALKKSPIMIVLDDITVTQSTLQNLDPQTIVNITALKGLAATNKYGSQAFGGVLLINTLHGTYAENKEKQDLRKQYNTYTETVPTLHFESAQADYIEDVAKVQSTRIKLEKYRSIKNTYLGRVDFYVDMAMYFQQIDAGAAREVRNDFALLAKDNSKALRILAYLHEHAGEFMQAQKVYERIIAMDPGNPQSYRDLALIYQETGAYDKALELYINMLGEQIPGIDFSTLTSVLSNELQRLINLHKHKINYQRLPNDWLATNFNIDVRMTASWSDNNAPFEFQFVNPDKRFYNWNSDEKRTTLKTKASATEEFVIDDAAPGDWLINVRYTGDENGTNIPPYLKYTLYKDFGTPKEIRTIKLVKLENQIEKVTLDSFTY